MDVVALNHPNDSQKEDFFNYFFQETRFSPNAINLLSLFSHANFYGENPEITLEDIRAINKELKNNIAKLFNSSTNTPLLDLSTFPDFKIKPRKNCPLSIILPFKNKELSSLFLDSVVVTLISTLFKDVIPNQLCILDGYYLANDFCDIPN